MAAGRTSVDVLEATKAEVRKGRKREVVACGMVDGCGVGCEARMDSALPCCRVVAMSW